MTRIARVLAVVAAVSAFLFATQARATVIGTAESTMSSSTPDCSIFDNAFCTNFSFAADTLSALIHCEERVTVNLEGEVLYTDTYWSLTSVPVAASVVVQAEEWTFNETTQLCEPEFAGLCLALYNGTATYLGGECGIISPNSTCGSFTQAQIDAKRAQLIAQCGSPDGACLRCEDFWDGCGWVPSFSVTCGDWFYSFTLASTSGGDCNYCLS